MKALTLKKIASAIGGKIISGKKSMPIEHVVTMSRDLQHDSLLFDIRHEFSAAKKMPPSLCCAIVTDSPANFASGNPNISLITVNDVKESLWRFVDFYRNQFNIPVIGVTGTCGKTTTKEMIRHILSGFYKVTSTYKSLNAQARHLDYLLEIDDSTQAAVYEMGLAYPHDILTCCRFFKPHVGVITTIGVDHLQAFKSLDAYIKGKAEMLEGLGNRGTLILNADDPNIAKIDKSNFKGNILYFGTDEKADYRILNPRDTENGIAFELHYRDTLYPIELPQSGTFNALNAAAAVAAVGAIGIGPQLACDMLASFKNVERHLEMKKGLHGSMVIDDTWSTNPTSAAAAIRFLKLSADREGKKTIAILGKMALLGNLSSVYHRETGRLVAKSGIDYLILLGSDAQEIAKGALEMGMQKERVIFCKDRRSAVDVVSEMLDSNTIALVKTSMLRHYSGLLDAITFE